EVDTAFGALLILAPAVTMTPTIGGANEQIAYRDLGRGGVFRAAGLCAEKERGCRDGIRRRRQARSAHRVDDAGQGTAELDVQRSGPDSSRQDQPGVHRA